MALRSNWKKYVVVYWSSREKPYTSHKFKILMYSAGEGLEIFIRILLNDICNPG